MSQNPGAPFEARAPREPTPWLAVYAVVLLGVPLLLAVAALGVGSFTPLETRELTYGGYSRPYVLYRPSEAGDGPLPLVLVLHGAGGSKELPLERYGWLDKAEREGFLVAAAEALPVSPARPPSFRGNPRIWNDGSGRWPQGGAGVDDSGYLLAVIDDILDRERVDPRRVYVTGFSNGASMAQHLGFQHPERLAAIAPVSGHLWDEGDALARPLPVLFVAGAVDPLNPLDDGAPRGPCAGGLAKERPPLRKSVERWARLDGCGAPEQGSLSEKVTRTAWADCAGGSEVALYVVEGLGHQWPGGGRPVRHALAGPQSNALDATDVIWRFFAEHPREAAKSP